MTHTTYDMIWNMDVLDSVKAALTATHFLSILRHVLCHLQRKYQKIVNVEQNTDAVNSRSKAVKH